MRTSFAIFLSENGSTFPTLDPKQIHRLEVFFVKRKQKITEFFFNEHDGTAEVYTHNTDLKKRLSQYAQTYPHLCQLTEEDENGGLRFEIDKRRISIRLTAPYSEERRNAAKKRGKESGFGKG
jgi:hypothetical protein